MTEVRRAILRIGSNYVRLLASVVLGLLLMLVLLRAFGSEAVGLILLLTSTASVSMVIEEAMESSVVRELGRAHHLGDEAQFRRMYNSALVVSASALLCVVACYAAIECILPLLKIPPTLLVAARWIVVAKAVESMAVVLASPAYNMYIVTERMLQANWWMFARRSTQFVSAVIVSALALGDVSRGLIAYAWIAAALHVGVIALAVAWIIWRDRRLLPNLRLADRDACGEIVRTSGANATMFITGLLQIPGGAWLMNLFLGLHGSFIFGLGVQLSGYVRMLTSGLTIGMEAVGARIATGGEIAGERSRVQTLAYHATRLQAFVAVPAALGMFVVAPSLVEVWLAKDGVDAQSLREIAITTRVLTLGMFAQCMLDIWWRLLYSAGHVRDYVRPFVAAGLLNMPLAIVLLVVLPKPIQFVGAAAAFTLMNSVLAFSVIPWVVSACFQLRRRRLALAVARPLLPAAACGMALVFIDRALAPPSVLKLMLEGAAFAAMLALPAYVFALDPSDRARLAAVIRRVLRRSPA